MQGFVEMKQAKTYFEKHQGEEKIWSRNAMSASASLFVTMQSSIEKHNACHIICPNLALQTQYCTLHILFEKLQAKC